MKLNKIFATSFLMNDDGVVCEHNTQLIGRPNKSIYFHGLAEKKMQKFGGWDIPCFYNYCPDDEDIYKVNILYKDNIELGTLFLWKAGSKINGLIIDNSDKINLEYAKTCYETKRYSI